MKKFGLREHDVEILACTPRLVTLSFTGQRLVRTHSQPVCIGQNKSGFCYVYVRDDEHVRMDLTEKPRYLMVGAGFSYWYPLGQVVAFKRDVYRRTCYKKSLAYQLPNRD